MIPPRPWQWFAEGWSNNDRVVDRDGNTTATCPRDEVAELIVRLVNAHQYVIIALEEAEATLVRHAHPDDENSPVNRTRALVRVALAKVRP